MEDQQTSQTPPKPRGLVWLLASLVFMGVAALAWFAIFSGFIFALSWLKDGAGAYNALVSQFETFDPRLLASDAVAQRLLFAGGSLMYLAALAGLLTGAHYFGGRDAGDRLGWRGAWPRMTRTGWILLALAPVYHIVAGATLRYFFPEFNAWLIAPRDPLALAMSFLMIVVLAPLVEELLFRGWIFGVLRARFSATFAILAVTFLFAVVHFDQTGLYPLAVLAPGFVLTLIRERTGACKASVLAHGIYNFAGWLLLVLAGFLLPEGFQV
ncbi:MAG: CPBP family intramembrane metalloprotease [Beijerinckiaceae bacterium]|nr:CPBP family intramembrane metalloprotease [Beijerinckiaceae bacterium]